MSCHNFKKNDVKKSNKLRYWKLSWCYITRNKFFKIFVIATWKYELLALKCILFYFVTIFRFLDIVKKKKCYGCALVSTWLFDIMFLMNIFQTYLSILNMKPLIEFGYHITKKNMVLNRTRTFIPDFTSCLILFFSNCDMIVIFY